VGDGDFADGAELSVKGGLAELGEPSAADPFAHAPASSTAAMPQARLMRS